MNRIALLVLVLLVMALALLLVYRSATGPAADFGPTEIRRQPETALQQVDSLLRQVRAGEAAAGQARDILNAIIEDDPVSDQTLQARRHLASLEQSLGNDTAAVGALMDAIQAHPGSEELPQLIFDLGLLLAGPLDRPGEAREFLERVVRFYPDHALAPEAMIRLARIRMAHNTSDQWHLWRQFNDRYPDSPLGKAWPEPEKTSDTLEADHE